MIELTKISKRRLGRVKEGGINYGFDISRNMFSKGNIGIRQKMLPYNCQGETIVDLFCV